MISSIGVGAALTPESRPLRISSESVRTTIDEILYPMSRARAAQDPAITVLGSISSQSSSPTRSMRLRWSR